MKRSIGSLLITFMVLNAISMHAQISNKVLTIEHALSYTVEELFDKIKNDLGVEMGYLPAEIDLSARIHLEAGRYTLGDVLEKLFPKSSYRLLWKPGKVLIKKVEALREDGADRRIYGYVADATSGEKLVGATVQNSHDLSGVTTNVYGYFSLRARPQVDTLFVRYLGYRSKEVTVPGEDDAFLVIELEPANQVLHDVMVTADPLQDKVSNTETGVFRMDVSELKALPALGGETDVIKSIQLIPGVQTVGEGTSAYFVRGGNYDQNLILLDEAPVYNPAHALGFFSVFNGDAIKDLTFYKSHMPAKYGGKISSVLDIRMKEGNRNEHHVSGGLGLISSRLCVEGPIAKDKSSFIVTGRRTYADLIYRTVSADEATQNTALYFYDLNTKANFQLGEKDRVYLSGFFGQDVNRIDLQQYGIVWDNSTVTLRWNHLYSNKLFSNTSLIYSRYNYTIGLNAEAGNIDWKSFIEDYTAKIDLDLFASASHQISFGLASTLHNITPGRTSDPGFNDMSLSDADALEHVLYADDEIRFTDKITVEIGVRATAFQNMGAATLYTFDENYERTDSAFYGKGTLYNTFFSVDPRVSVNLQLNKHASVKVSYNRASQFIHIVQNNLIPFSTFDQWIISNPNIKPNYAHHFNLGYYRYVEKYGLAFSADTYYKKMLNQIDAADHAYLLLNKYIEGEMRTGKAYAYGFEVSVEKPEGVVQGRIGYTYARAKRAIRDINKGRTYNAPYDKPHTIQSSVAWFASRRVTLGANWVYSSGGPVTLPSGTFLYNGKSVPVYEGRNQYRMPAYHRLDLSLTLNRRQKPGMKNHSSWVFSVYNAYSRKNPMTIFASQKLDSEGVDIIDPSTQAVYKTWLFSIVPSVTYNFNF